MWFWRTVPSWPPLITAAARVRWAERGRLGRRVDAPALGVGGAAAAAAAAAAPAAREAAVAAAYARWFDNAPAAARTWLDAANLPIEFKNRLRWPAAR